jgi:hypothetical protein
MTKTRIPASGRPVAKRKMLTGKHARKTTWRISVNVSDPHPRTLSVERSGSLFEKCNGLFLVLHERMGMRERVPTERLGLRGALLADRHGGKLVQVIRLL